MGDVCPCLPAALLAACVCASSKKDWFGERLEWSPQVKDPEFSEPFEKIGLEALDVILEKM